MDIQLYPYGASPVALSRRISHTGLRSRVLSDLSDVRPGFPLLVLYCDPLEAIRTDGDASFPAPVGVLLEHLSALKQAGVCFRLVNVSCASIPGLVGWCVDPSAPIPDQAVARFAIPDPLEALVALEWLNEHQVHLQAYHSLEAHPWAAALDGRAPDVDCLGRYRQAASLDALLGARQERIALEADLAELAAQLEPARDQQSETVALREQIAFLQARLHEADALEERCSELQLSLQAQQLDLEQMARRLALLEELVGGGSDASLRLLDRLAQALSG